MGRVRLADTGALLVGFRRVQGAETAIFTQVTLPGPAYAAGQQLDVRLQVTGTSPTTLRWKVWRSGSAEPAAWTVTATDTTAGLQVAGHVGTRAYVSSSATNLPVTVTLDRFRWESPPP